MTPQDPQSPLSDTANNPATPQSGADLSAQIPPTYASGNTAAPSGGSPLQDALAAQLGGSTSAPANDPASTPTPAADPVIDAHIASEEPDPMAGFSAPSAAAPEPMPAQASTVTQPVMDAPAPVVAEPAPASVPGVQPAADFAAMPMGPAPVAAQTYDPNQDVGVGAPATSYPAAPEPLPPNPLEMDAASVPPTPIQSETPAPMPVAPEPVAAPMPAAPEPMSAPVMEQTPIDPVSGAPVAAGIDAQPAMSQGTDPTLQSMLDAPAVTSDATSVDPYSDPALMAAASPSSGAKGGKGILMALGIGAAVLIGGIVVLALILGRKPVTEVPADSLSGEQQQTETADLEATITVPEGYVAIVKQCFEFALPTDNTVALDDTECKVDATFGSQGISTIAVLPSITNYDSLDKAVAASKEANSIIAANTVSERQITLGGFDAQEVVFNAGTTEAPQNKTIIVVLLEDSKYKLDGDTITSFEINMTSNDEFTKSAVSTLESTWSWK